MILQSERREQTAESRDQSANNGHQSGGLPFAQRNRNRRESQSDGKRESAKRQCGDQRLMEFRDNGQGQHSERQMESMRNGLHQKADDDQHPAPATFRIVMLAQCH